LLRQAGQVIELIANHKYQGRDSGAADEQEGNDLHPQSPISHLNHSRRKQFNISITL
jgi:hypothetical protein